MAILRLAWQFGRIGDDELGSLGLSSALTACLSSAPGTGELDARSRGVTLTRLPDSRPNGLRRRSITTPNARQGGPAGVRRIAE